ncbi:MAG: hypothetical protein EZS28_007247 [Streblomastix strix]|uniref:Maf-like protein n=1 Tax=Streblomastix strix TaxID=222440 RepID=A0A5J4WRK9_9EUKA|nr:MAG: hypothetical protein EZS28_007247 [Streblomastix strix]
MKKVILASQSNNRKSICEEAGLDPIVIVSESDELDAEDGNLNKTRGICCENAKLKGFSVLKKIENQSQEQNEAFHGIQWIISADTLVLLEGKATICKPDTIEKAHEMFKSMIGQQIFVITGVCMIPTDFSRSIGKSFQSNESLVFAATTQLFFNEKYLSDENERTQIFLKADPRNKAGGFLTSEVQTSENQEMIMNDDGGANDFAKIFYDKDFINITNLRTIHK